MKQGSFVQGHVPVQAIAAANACGAPDVAYAGTINVSICGARNEVGIIRCGLFASADGFRGPGRELQEIVSKPSCAFGSSRYKFSAAHSSYLK
jgi:hypothetical protein